MISKELNDLIDRRAEQYLREIKERAEFARRSIGQKLRFARARQRKDGK